MVKFTNQQRLGIIKNYYRNNNNNNRSRKCTDSKWAKSVDSTSFSGICHRSNRAYFFVDETTAMLTSMESTIMLCWKIICGQNWMNLTSTIFGFNKTVPLATQHSSQLIYWKANYVNVLSREMVRSNDRLVHAI